MELNEKIVKILMESEPLKLGEICEILKLDKKLVEKEIKKLKEDEIIISPKRCFYSIKK